MALDDVEKDSIIAESLQEVYSAGKRAKDLVEQIQAFARQTDQPTRPVQMAKIVKEGLKFIRSSTPAAIELKQNIDGESLILGNPTQIHQIIMNLCANAAHAMDKSGGILEVALKDMTIDDKSALFREGVTPGDYIQMTVSDTGVGIPADILDKIFDPYFTSKAMGEGIGLGLSMVQGIAEKSRGIIVVEGRIGEGTTFRVYLPITHAGEINNQDASRTLPTGTERILSMTGDVLAAELRAIRPDIPIFALPINPAMVPRVSTKPIKCELNYVFPVNCVTSSVGPQG